MDIQRFYEDYNISYQTEGHKHCRPGWVNTECPFCSGNPGLHLGFNLMSNTFTCWRCGYHPLLHTLSTLIKESQYNTFKILESGYNTTLKRSKSIKLDAPKLEHRFPSNTKPLSIIHKNYLAQRNFDPDQLEYYWNLMGTGPISFLDKIDYRFRVLIPYLWNEMQVSFDARDITNKHQNKYQACPLQREFVEHKRILYGKQEYWGKTGICVEGTTDVWRLGVNAFATSGIKYTPSQLRLISNNFKKVFVIFDSEPQAQRQAKKLISDLQFRGIKAKNILLESDPADLKPDDAKHLVKSELKLIWYDTK